MLQFQSILLYWVSLPSLVIDELGVSRRNKLMINVSFISSANHNGIIAICIAPE